jgi:hypothetical protein
LHTASTIASLMWRLSRVPRLEAAAMQPLAAELPPHPETVMPHCDLTMTRPLPTAPAAERLARCKHDLECSRNSRERYLNARRRLDSKMRPRQDDEEWGMPERRELQDAAGDVLGWPPCEMERWNALAAKLHPSPEPESKSEASQQMEHAPKAPTETRFEVGFEFDGKPEAVTKSHRWTAERLAAAFALLAVEFGRTPAEFRRAIRRRLSELIQKQEHFIAAGESECERLAEEMRSERERAIVRHVFAAGETMGKLHKSEQHLARQLEHSFALLERLQRERRRPSDARHARTPLPTIGFVFPPSLSGPAAQPAFEPAEVATAWPAVPSES